MSYYAQLLYIKLILFAAETYNKIPKLIPTLMSALRMELEIGQFKSALEEIKNNYPKFKANKYFYYFDEFEHKTNWLPSQQSPSNRPAIAQHSIEKKRKDKEKRREEKPPKLSDLEFIETLKTDPIYKHIDFDFEFKKMTKWFLVNPNRQKTRRFIVNWLNKVERPVEIKKEEKFKPVDKDCKICSGTGFVFNQARSSNDFCKCRIK